MTALALRASPVRNDGVPSTSDTRIPVVHAVTNDEIAHDAAFERKARAVMAALGTRGAVHLRAALLSGAELHALAERLADAQRETGCWLVMNDRVDIALAVGARGVQLTSRSMGVVDARAIAHALAPSIAVGASAHDIPTATDAEAHGATWIVAGHVFPTRTHPGEHGRGTAFLTSVARAVRIPVIAIGGIRPRQVAGLRAAGAAGVAAIRGIWNEDDAEAAARDYLSSYDAVEFAQRDDDAPGER